MDDEDRLDAALERIARATARRRRASAPGLPAADADELAGRLDTLIAELRAALGPGS